jgi:hypothetical protein
MKILGIDGMTEEQLRKEVRRGGKFVFYEYCISILILTFKRPSDVYFIPVGKSTVVPGLRFSLLSLLLGWWGIPWGPIFTISVLGTNFSGGNDVTGKVLASLRAKPQPQTDQGGLALGPSAGKTIPSSSYGVGYTISLDPLPAKPKGKPENRS